jgi:hypothetical protein
MHGWSRRSQRDASGARDTQKNCMSENVVAAAGANSPKIKISRRDELNLVVAGMAVSLPLQTSRTKPFDEFRQPTHSENMGEHLSSYIKVGQENSTPTEVCYEDHGTGQTSSPMTP